ncbi:hypothetical protein Taro_041173 [Colocasia esculenta]|uniref:Uncharacterized protein n=1 Tax=Colocasia esculenta TaxID=4460 RepID=A0A843WKU0_COLES|nr:hypothetical protein [Colocasia esculenta]
MAGAFMQVSPQSRASLQFPTSRGLLSNFLDSRTISANFPPDRGISAIFPIPEVFLQFSALPTAFM